MHMTFRQSLYKSDSLLYQITLHYVNQVPKRKFKHTCIHQNYGSASYGPIW